MAKKYKCSNGQMIIDTERNCWIPQDIFNIDYQNYQKWLDEGNVPDPADPPEDPNAGKEKETCLTCGQDYWVSK